MPFFFKTTVLRSLIVQMERIEPSLHLVLEHQLSLMWKEFPQAKLIFTEGKLQFGSKLLYFNLISDCQ